MREAIRCCIACILPCGALDVVRVVHATGRVEEIRGAVTAGDVMREHPDHVLRRPPDGAEATKAVTLPPDAELERGRIYFLAPVETAARRRRRRCRRKGRRKTADSDGAAAAAVEAVAADKAMREVNEQYLSEILSEKASAGYRERRRGRVSVWRPHLDSISETSTEL